MLLTVVFGVAASSAEQSSGKYLLSEATYNSLTQVHGWLESGKSQQALEALKTLVPKVRSRSYDSAVVHQTMGYAYHMLGDDAHAIESFEQALDKHALPEEVEHALTYNLAQMLISAERYQSGLHYLEQWFPTETKPSAEAYLLAGTANYGLKQYKAAIPYLKKAIAATHDPPESWYQLLLNSYYELSYYHEASVVLGEMVRRFPDEKTYWIQLAGVYQRLKRDQDALATLELAYRRAMLDEPQLVRLVQLYLYMNTPYRAAELLEAELDKGGIKKTAGNWTLLADALLLAQERERAARALQQAAELARDTTLYYRLGQILYDLEQWPAAVEALESALNRGDLKETDWAYLMLGIAAYRAGDAQRAVNALTHAQGFEKTHNQAKWWLERVYEELMNAMQGDRQALRADLGLTVSSSTCCLGSILLALSVQVLEFDSCNRDDVTMR